ncbi:Hypothetical protein CINCED_3A002187, partial [Cinara cedri]
MLSTLTNSILSVSQKLPIIKSDSNRTTNHNYHPVKSQFKQSLDMADETLKKALKREKREGWGKKIKRIKKEVQGKEIQNIQDENEMLGKEVQETQDDHKVYVISHNTLVTRGFIGFSQSRFAEDLICDGMEIDLSYSKD